MYLYIHFLKKCNYPDFQMFQFRFFKNTHKPNKIHLVDQMWTPGQQFAAPACGWLSPSAQALQTCHACLCLQPAYHDGCSRLSLCLLEYLTCKDLPAYTVVTFPPLELFARNVILNSFLSLLHAFGTCCVCLGE